MSAQQSTVTIRCDWRDCAAALRTNRRTVRSARNDAERRGWKSQHMAGGDHPSPSEDPDADDLCPRHHAAWRASKGLPPLAEHTAKQGMLL
jgi:hypothetical protein